MERRVSLPQSLQMPPRSHFPGNKGALCVWGGPHPSLTVSLWGFDPNGCRRMSEREGRDVRSTERLIAIISSKKSPLLPFPFSPSSWALLLPFPPLQCTKGMLATLFSLLSSFTAILEVHLALTSLVWATRGERKGDQRWFSSSPLLRWHQKPFLWFLFGEKLYLILVAWSNNNNECLIIFNFYCALGCAPGTLLYISHVLSQSFQQPMKEFLLFLSPCYWWENCGSGLPKVT